MPIALRLAPYLLVLAAIAGAGWYVQSLHTQISRLERDLQAERGLRATERATREAQARRAIETVRRQESETRASHDDITEQLRRVRAGAAADIAAAGQRVRDITAARAATAARGDRLPAVAPDASGVGGADPIGFLLAILSEDEADSRLADDTAARLGACYDRLRADRGLAIRHPQERAVDHVRIELDPDIRKPDELR